LLDSLLNTITLPSLEISKPIEYTSWEELARQRLDSREQSSEGLMLKKKDSSYGIGEEMGSWYTWEVDPLTIDGVLIYAQKGQSTSTDLFSEFTFGVWDGELLVSFTKSSSGLTNAEIREVDAYVKKNTKEKFGPVRTVTPGLVFEIAFEGIQASPRHKSGIALRFPRIARWRKDKTIDQANSLADLQALLY
jgi:DNA ligase-1